MPRTPAAIAQPLAPSKKGASQPVLFSSEFIAAPSIKITHCQLFDAQTGLARFGTA
jgi:hypothetical protein